MPVRGRRAVVELPVGARLHDVGEVQAPAPAVVMKAAEVPAAVEEERRALVLFDRNRVEGEELPAPAVRDRIGRGRRARRSLELRADLEDLGGLLRDVGCLLGARELDGRDG